MQSTAYAPRQPIDRDVDSVSSSGLLQRSGPRSVEAWSRTRVVIANAQPIVRHGLRALLAEEDDLDVVGEAESGSAAVKLARQLRPDVVVIDLVMAELDGISATRLIRTAAPGTQVVVMTGINENGPAIESIRAGACAYLPKEAGTDALLRAIRGASTGQVALPSAAVAALVRPVGRHEALSERESEVMRLVAQGLPNKQIARELDIAQSTVKSHIGNLLGKLGLLSRTQLALYAARTGLVALDHADLTPAF
jgi:two-component system, NarL family, response regulator LiaR